MKHFILITIFALISTAGLILMQDSSTPTAPTEQTAAHWTIDYNQHDAPIAVMTSWPTPQSPEELAPAPTEAEGSWIKSNWESLLIGLIGFLEILLRFIPTGRTYSIITWLIRLINYVIPDRAGGGRRFVEPGKDVR